MMRVVVADDDPRIRADFETILELEPDIEVVATVANGEEAVAANAELQPDVIVMDVRMPRLNGIEATRLIRRSAAEAAAVLVVTTFDLDQYVLDAIHAGAAGFLLKQTAADQLADAVRIVAAGEAIVSPRATARLMREITGATSSPTGAQDSALSLRELEIVRLMAGGLSNIELAKAAGISRATVKSHVSSILSKLGLSSRIQIVVWAHQRGLLPRE